MLSNWQNWCRLCAKYDTNNFDIFLKSESIINLTQIIQNHFNLIIEPHDHGSKMICQTCYDYILNLNEFTNNCFKINSMYADLIFNFVNGELSDDYIKEIRIKFGLHTDEKVNINLIDNPPHTTVIKEENDNFSSVNVEETQSSHSDNINHDIEFNEDIDNSDESMNESENEKESKQIKKKIFSCTKCPKTFSLKKNAKRHELIHLPPELKSLYPCSFCDKKFTRSANVQAHIKTIHEREKSLQKQIETDNADIENSDSNDSDESFDEEKFKKESKTVKRNLFSCSKCPKKFSLKKNAKRHEAVHLPPELKLLFPCSVCNKKFTRPATLQAHIKAKHENAKSFICEECGESFNTKVLLKVHQIVHNDKTPYECNICPERFKTLAKLQIHEQVHSDTKYPCHICDVEFNTMQILKKHMNMHSDVKNTQESPYMCEECGKPCSSKSSLKEHKLVHTNEKPFECPICHLKFKSLTRMKVHKQIHNETKLICKICGLQLNTKRTLRTHMVVHSDKKNFKCHYCGNEFKRSKTLKYHLLSHTGLKPFICPFCGKTFASRVNCRNHKKKIHPEELAAAELDGNISPVKEIPKLEELQPKSIYLNKTQLNTHCDIQEEFP